MPRTRRDPKSQQILVAIVGAVIIAAVVGVSFAPMTQATNSENYVKTIQTVLDQSKGIYTYI